MNFTVGIFALLVLFLVSFIALFTWELARKEPKVAMGIVLFFLVAFVLGHIITWFLER